MSTLEMIGVVAFTVVVIVVALVVQWLERRIDGTDAEEGE